MSSSQFKISEKSSLVCDDSDNKGSFVSTVRGAREKKKKIALQYFLNPQERRTDLGTRFKRRDADREVSFLSIAPQGSFPRCL
jgi:hypothetical protein